AGPARHPAAVLLRRARAARGPAPAPLGRRPAGAAGGSADAVQPTAERGGAAAGGAVGGTSAGPSAWGVRVPDRGCPRHRRLGGMGSAFVMGGPIAGWLIRRHPIMPPADAQLEVGRLYGDESRTTLDYQGVLLALFWLNIALMLGQAISGMIAGTGLMLPAFV